MLKKFSKRMSAFIIALTLTLMSVPLATHAASDDIITIIHTNDMHGRLAEEAKEGGHTKLAGLKYYIEASGADFVFDAGDAIQGLPISNFEQGKYMLEAMEIIGYNAMTLGNHEFDFGQDVLLEHKNDYDDKRIHMLSNSVYKGNDTLFRRNTVITKDSLKIGVIGTTTPETTVKTHPHNVKGLEFRKPLPEIKKDIEALEKENLDLIVVLAHLGNDISSEEDVRGDLIAEELSNNDYDTNILFIDGHAHQEIPEGKLFNNKVLYVQTGEYLNNIGHVEVNLKKFEESTAKLVASSSITLPSGVDTILEIEEIAKEEYDLYANQVVINDFSLDLTSKREYVRSIETALGNLISDAILEYGRTGDNKVDLAVMNGGGIRADLKPGDLTIGDILAVIPFGNEYMSVEVTGKILYEMFENSLKTPLKLDDNGKYLFDEDIGTYFPGELGGFLQVAGARIFYNPFNEVGNKVSLIEIEDNGSYTPVDLDEIYVLAANDFLIAGGDGFDMLVIDDHITGDILEEALIRFLNFGSFDENNYKEQFPKTRIIQDTFSEATAKALFAALERVSEIDEDKYTEDSIQRLLAVLTDVEKYVNEIEKEERIPYEHELLELIERLEDAIEKLEEVPVEEPTPSEPEEPKEPEKPEPKPTEPDEGRKDDAKPSDNLPATGSVSLAYPAIILVALGIITKVISKRRE